MDDCTTCRVDHSRVDRRKRIGSSGPFFALRDPQSASSCQHERMKTELVPPPTLLQVDGNNELHSFERLGPALCLLAYWSTPFDRTDV